MNLLDKEEEKESKKRKPKMIRYVGKGTTLRDIPAKDMTMDEWEKLPKERRDHALHLGLYEEQ